MLRSLIRLGLYVRAWCKLIRKWPRNTPNVTPNNNNQRYAVSSHSEDMLQDVCQH